MAMQVHRNEAAQKFELTADEQRATLDYQMEGPDLALDHTYVPSALRGQGIAQQLATAALDYARDNNLKVLPYCGFVQKFIAGHPKYQELVSASFRK